MDNGGRSIHGGYTAGLCGVLILLDQGNNTWGDTSFLHGYCMIQFGLREGRSL